MGDFAVSLAKGQIGESVISRWLQARGHAVFPAYQVEYHTGKGPQLFSSSGNLVLPDLLAFRSGKIHWFEAKHKTCFTWHRISRSWTTGIDLRHYGEYLQVAGLTEIPVYLLFWHPNSEPSKSDKAHGCPPKCPVGLFGGDILELSQRENHRSDRHGNSGMVYWRHDCLTKYASVEMMMGEYA